MKYFGHTFVVLAITWSLLLALQPQPEYWYTKEEQQELIHLYIPSLNRVVDGHESQYFCLPTESGGVLMKKQALLGLHWPVLQNGFIYPCVMYQDDMRKKPWERGLKTPV